MPSQETLELFSTCPASVNTPREQYLARVAEVARWSERHGCKGILVYSDNRQVDAWLVSQLILQHTTALCPLVAVQPAYMHPYTVAKLITSAAWLYGRRLYLNLVAGGFKNDLEALNDPTEHDRRYERLTEYTLLIKALLAGDSAVTRQGAFYGVTRLKLTPPLPTELFPGLFVSGSSPAGLAAARAIGATAVKYPRPPGQEEPAEPGLRTGARIGIIAREDGTEAWRVARERFVPDRRGQLARQLAAKVSDSVWHRRLADRAGAAGGGGGDDGPYWLTPFEHYQTMCPYLVGSYDEVGVVLSRYLALGYDAFILDIPTVEEDLSHARVAFERAAALVGP